MNPSHVHNVFIHTIEDGKEILVTEGILTAEEGTSDAIIYSNEDIDEESMWYNHDINKTVRGGTSKEIQWANDNNCDKILALPEHVLFEVDSYPKMTNERVFVECIHPLCSNCFESLYMSTKIDSEYTCKYCGTKNDSDRPIVIKTPIVMYDTPEKIGWDEIEEKYNEEAQYYEDPFTWLRDRYLPPEIDDNLPEPF